MLTAMKRSDFKGSRAETAFGTEWRAGGPRHGGGNRPQGSSLVFLQFGVAGGMRWQGGWRGSGLLFHIRHVFQHWSLLLTSEGKRRLIELGEHCTGAGEHQQRGL